MSKSLPAVVTVMLESVPGVYSYQTVAPMSPQGCGSSGSSVASALLSVSSNVEVVMTVAAAKLSFGGGVAAELTRAWSNRLPAMTAPASATNETAMHANARVRESVNRYTGAPSK